MTTATDVIVFTEEMAEQFIEELGLSHPDVYRLVRYVWLVQKYPLSTSEDYYRDNLWKWISDEQEVFYGDHESAYAFAKHYHENYRGSCIPYDVVVNWEETWDTYLRHDFTAEDHGRGVYVWADVY